jgi:hypothetical protein
MMNKLLNYYNDHTTQVTITFGLVVGLLLGLLVGWVLWPREYYNATPNILRQDFRDAYLSAVATQYAADGDIERAQALLGLEFWDEGKLSATIQNLAERVGGEDATRLLVLDQALSQAAPPAQPPASQGLNPTFLYCGVGLIVTAVAALAYLALNRIRSARRPISEKAVASRTQEPGAWAGDAAPPVAQFLTTYTLGDDFYDPSFSIENDAGDFMGECGVGISESIGVGDPKKVTALEIWLFDKNDIRTVTRVIMSDYAFHDEALRARLASKGDQLLVEEGGESALETATLILRARIVELEYGEGPLPTRSFFQRLTLELGIWIKPDAVESSDIGELDASWQ